ncbi:MAG: hypothetical protein PUC88_01300 [Clostridia bacterium]|nr:hypothetical protein [Clostridia bacterium]
MSIFDKLKQGANNTVNSVAQNAIGSLVNKKKTFTFTTLPESLAQMQALPEATLSDPFQTAALTVCALCVYAADKNIGIEMLNWLRGPRPLSAHEISFHDDRFRDGQTYVPFSYFEGATPENDYTPKQPFTLTIESNPTSDDVDGYFKAIVKSGGADSPRSIMLRMRGDGKWFLWEHFLLVGIRVPKSADPWA